MPMTENGNLKRRVRARAARTGESYTAALRHVRGASRTGYTPEARTLHLAVAQTGGFDDPRDVAGLHASGEELRRLMRDAHRAGARLVHFPEGAICAPAKRIMSALGPAEVGPADWGRVAWATLREELLLTCDLARELRLWTVFGSVHRLTPPNRPHNSLYVVSDQGALVTRYDERLMSHTKVSFMYTPGRAPVTFDVEGVRFGCALGMEAHYPEIFQEYERLDVDCVLFSTTGSASSPNGQAFAAEVLGHAASNAYWVSFATHAPQSRTAPAGIAAPGGQWAAEATRDGAPSIAVADVGNDPAGLARSWRRTARSNRYAPHMVTGDPRSEERDRL